VNLYIATKFNNQAAFHDLKGKLEAKGHSVTLDWTKEDSSKVAKKKLKKYLTQCAINDADAVIASHALILLPVPDMAGALVELGIALGCGCPIIIVDAFKEGNQKPIFYHMPEDEYMFKHVANEEELFAQLEKLDKMANVAKEMVATALEIARTINVLDETSKKTVLGNN